MKYTTNTPSKRLKSSAKAIGYIRVSTDEQKISPEAQRESIQRWALLNKINVLAIYEDIGVSGSTPPPGRDGMSRALDHIQVERCDWLVVATHDRIARDAVQAMMLEEVLKSLKAQLVTTLEDPSQEFTPEDKIRRQIIQIFAEYERAMIRRRTRAALQALKLAGKKLGRPSYSRTAAGRASARRVHELHAQGLGLRTIVRTLTREQTPTLSGTGDWHRATIQSILSRPLDEFQEPAYRTAKETENDDV